MLTQALYYGRSTKPLAWVVPDERWPKMWRIHWPDGSISEMVNLSRAKDAAVVICLRSAASHDSRMFHWEPAHRQEAIPGGPRALNGPPGVLQTPEPTTRYHGPQEVPELNALPDRILLFQGPHEREAEDDDDLVASIAETLIHEIGHYFGLTEEEIEEIEERYWRNDPEESDDGDIL